MAARSCLKCKEQGLIGFEGYNCGSTAVVKCRWAALLHRLPQSKNHVGAERILPVTNLLYLTLKFSKSRLWEVPSSCLLLRLRPTARGIHGPEVAILILFTSRPESSAAGTDQQTLLVFSPGKKCHCSPHHVLRILPWLPLNCNLCCPVFSDGVGCILPSFTPSAYFS